MEYRKQTAWDFADGGIQDNRDKRSFQGSSETIQVQSQ